MSSWSSNLLSCSQLSSINHGHPHDAIPNNSWDHQTIRIERASQIMDDDLKPWGLYSLDGVEQPESLESMKNLFTRYRTVRGKGMNYAYTEDALQQSWCDFIRRGNASRREGTSFTSWIERREDTHGVHYWRFTPRYMSSDPYRVPHVLHPYP